MSFNPLDYSLCLEEPAFLSDVTSWHEHIPFAFTLMQMLQPERFVELGTHKGDSYLAFCQAVDTLGLSTVCCAVDSWQGDPQAGFYGEEIYRTLKQYHDLHYGHFSSLRRCYFDDALPHFADKSIDLLHIDGLHTYEAVKHDFETWLPKMSARGIVLLHDTAVTAGDFGVWRFFEEVSSKYPAFEFKHCNGLGMIAVGSEVPAPLQPFFDKEHQALGTIAGFYQAIGARLSLGRTVRRLETKAAELELETSRLECDLNERGQQLQDAQRTLQRQATELSERDRRLVDQGRQLIERDLILQEKEKALADLEQSFLNSLSWKVTAPLRRVYELIRGSGRRATASIPARSLALTTFPTNINAPTSIPACENPKVSIIIPVYNQLDYTLSCLASIAANTDGIEYEVIIADDASTDETLSIKDQVSNVIHIRNTDNLGFLRNCNNAAQSARGKYILFLNNDTNVQKDWLRHLLDLMDADDSIGLTGSKLVYSDGRLQEAGGIIWNDANGRNYGRLDDPTKPEYNYVKEVDYISGASIMIRKTLWDEIGGFDERFCPAYYEDTDLAFTVRHLGARVVYQPKSVVVHFEGISHGTDVTQGIKSYQVRNKALFLDKWKEILAEDHLPMDQNLFLARDRSRTKKTLLFIDYQVPLYDKFAGSRTNYMYLKLLVEMGLNVKFIGADFLRIEPYSSELNDLGIETLDGEWYREKWEQWFKDNGRYIDYVLLNKPDPAVKFMDVIKKYTAAKIIYQGHDLHHVRLKRKYEIEGLTTDLTEAERYEQIEKAIFDKSDTILTFSSVEEAEIRRLAPNKPVYTVPLYFYDSFSEDITDFSERRGILFVGGFIHTPNVDAVKWFTSEILPLVAKNIQNITFFVVGGNPPDAIRKLSSKQVKILGFVSDDVLAEYYRTCRLVVVPLRFGAGVKGKTIEAMYHGLPIVSTSIGLEGIDGIEQVIKATDDAAVFARQILEMYSEPQRLAKIGMANKTFVREKFSKTKTRETAENIFKSPS